MKTLLAALLALSLLSACANTRDGIARDSERMGQKVQEIGDLLAAP